MMTLTCDHWTQHSSQPITPLSFFRGLYQAARLLAVLYCTILNYTVLYCTVLYLAAGLGVSVEPLLAVCALVPRHGAALGRHHGVVVDVGVCNY